MLHVIHSRVPHSHNLTGSNSHTLYTPHKSTGTHARSCKTPKRTIELEYHRLIDSTAFMSFIHHPIPLAIRNLQSSKSPILYLNTYSIYLSLPLQREKATSRTRIRFRFKRKETETKKIREIESERTVTPHGNPRGREKKYGINNIMYARPSRLEVLSYLESERA